MPKATMHKDDRAITPENNIWITRKFWIVDSESKTSRMEHTSDN